MGAELTVPVPFLLFQYLAATCTLFGKERLVREYESHRSQGRVILEPSWTRKPDFVRLLVWSGT